MLSKMKIMGGELLRAIPMNILNEKWAQKNHGQSLERLNKRGGLGVSEALAIAENRRWHVCSEILSELALMRITADALTPAAPAAIEEK